MGVELMQLIGWDKRYYKNGSDSHLKYSTPFLTQLAGNAFSAFSISAIVIAAIASLILEKPKDAVKDAADNAPMQEGEESEEADKASSSSREHASSSSRCD